VLKRQGRWWWSSSHSLNTTHFCWNQCRFTHSLFNKKWSHSSCLNLQDYVWFALSAWSLCGVQN
jgi:hypothetical protein